MAALLLRAQLREGDAGLEAASSVVVMIDGAFADRKTQGAGIVFAVRDGYVWIATMHHVVRVPGQEGADDTLARNVRVRFRQRRLQTFPAEHHDRAMPEVAVIKVRASDLQFDFARLGEASGLKGGDDVHAIGHPAGDDWGVTWNPQKLGSRGSDWLELQSRDIEPGHSGGALIDGGRRLVGMVNLQGGARARAMRMDKVRRVLEDDLGLPVELTVRSAAVAPVERFDRGGMRYVRIPRGKFRMGCSESPKDEECANDEFPAHDVKITRDFWMGESEVTIGAYENFRATGVGALPHADDLGRKLNTAVGDPAVPAVGVTWVEASLYCAWAGGEGLRLPTEAQWEYAARAGTTGKFYASPLDDIAWFGDNSGNRPIDATKVRESALNYGQYVMRLLENGNVFHVVKQKRANAWGLYDMLGNVREWTADFYGLGYYTQSPAEDPTGPGQATDRVLRGGDWGNAPTDVRVSLRNGSVSTDRDNGIGFRCAGELR